MEQIRAFIAIELTDKVKVALSLLQEKLKSKSRASVKWVDPHSIHLTLKFLGNIDSNIIDEINEVLEEAARGIEPFKLEIQGLGVFPNLKRVQIIWVGITGDLNRLNQLRLRVESGLEPLGFVPESRPFTPHLTLARLRDRVLPHERQQLGEIIASTRFETDCTMVADTIFLIQSQLTREGPIYTRIGSIPLVK